MFFPDFDDALDYLTTSQTFRRRALPHQARGWRPFTFSFLILEALRLSSPPFKKIIWSRRHKVSIEARLRETSGLTPS